MSSDNESFAGGDDENDIVEIGEDLDQVEQTEENTEEVQRDEDADGEGGGKSDGEGERKTVKPKRVVRNPQPKLNEETIKGSRGIAALESYFERVKFKGKGYEHQDLNVIMKTYEYWCHRLFPKFPFDTCIERLEKLGTKKAVQTHIRRIRFDLFVEDKPIIDSSDEDDEMPASAQPDTNEQFDQLLPHTLSKPQDPVDLTVEQLERIRLNKERAEKVRLERLQKIQEKAAEKLDISSQIPGTSGLENVTEDDFDSTQGSIGPPEEEISSFDHESTIKGKNVVKGSTVKKKAKVIIDVDSSSNESTSLQQTNQNGVLFDSDEEASITNSKRKPNVLDSDESDQETDINSTMNVMSTKSRSNFVDSDEDMEVSSNQRNHSYSALDHNDFSESTFQTNGTNMEIDEDSDPTTAVIPKTKGIDYFENKENSIDNI